MNRCRNCGIRNEEFNLWDVLAVIGAIILGMLLPICLNGAEAIFR